MSRQRAQVALTDGAHALDLCCQKDTSVDRHRSGPVGALLWPEEHVAVHGDPLQRQPIDFRSKTGVDMIVWVEAKWIYLGTKDDRHAAEALTGCVFWVPTQLVGCLGQNAVAEGRAGGRVRSWRGRLTYLVDVFWTRRLNDQELVPAIACFVQRSDPGRPTDRRYSGVAGLARRQRKPPCLP